MFISLSTLGQEELKIVSKYKDTERLGNFLTRWYYDIVGTSLVWKKRLTLYSDSTYHYTYHGGECGTFDEDRKGIWIMKGDTLILKTDEELFNHYFLVAKDKLYHLEADIKNNPNKWIMK